jgi:hypothetical protein
MAGVAVLRLHRTEGLILGSLGRRTSAPVDLSEPEEAAMRIGYFLSSEELDPRELIRQARMAEGAVFDGLWISDHHNQAAALSTAAA